MDIQFFNDTNHVPQPKHKTQIEALSVTPYPDRFRVFITIKVTPFLERPNLLLVVHDEHDRIVGELNVIETMHANMEFTIHIRTPNDPAGEYELGVELFYETRNPTQDRQSIVFTIPVEGE